MNLSPSRIIVAAACFSLAACATHRNRVIEAPIKAPPVVVGKVALVRADAGFVLVQTAANLETGETLTSRDKDGAVSSTLKVSAEKKQPFIIANIANGTPKAGEIITKDRY
jgi:hypothetical protein